MQFDLDDDRRHRMVARVRGFFLESFDEEISEFRAEQLVDFLLTDLAPHVYNQAVHGAGVRCPSGASRRNSPLQR